MSEDAKQALDDARRLFEHFVASPWRSLEVSHGAMRLTISRLNLAERDDLFRSQASAPRSDFDALEEQFTAPHVASLRDLAAVGSTIRAGEIYATLEVLDELIVLRANRDIRPTAHLVEAGALLDFGQPMMRATTI